MNPECTTITWNEELNVPATCGTATLTGSEMSTLGCYPTVDCESKGSLIPGATVTNYQLECDSIKLVASAVIAAAIAYTF